MQNDIKLKKSEQIIPIESLKAVELGPNDTLIIEVPAKIEISKEVAEKIKNSISNVTSGKTLLLSRGLTAKAILKGTES